MTKKKIHSILNWIQIHVYEVLLWLCFTSHKQIDDIQTIG